jgi:hypothetical protein
MNLRYISRTTVLWAVLISGMAAARGQSSDVETNLKAVFLYNFTKYVEWPPNGERTFIIGIVGSSDITDALQEIARTDFADDKKIVIRQFDRLEQITPCRILFISRRSKLAMRDILEKTVKGELTVSEEAGGAHAGAIFNFVVVGDKLKFEVNIKALAASDLRVSSQLLRLAILVN